MESVLSCDWYSHPSLRNVPWTVTTARDKETYDPDPVIAEKHVTSDDIEKQLEALGYR